MYNDKQHGISEDTQILIQNYYNDLIVKKQTKNSKEIASDLGISVRSVNMFWNMIGINRNSIGYDYTNYAKLVLLHTEFQKNCVYYQEQQRVAEELEKERQKRIRNKEIINRLKEISELKKARTTLVNTLNVISEKQKVKTK